MCAADELRLLAAILTEERKTSKLLKKLIYGRRLAVTGQVHTAAVWSALPGTCTAGFGATSCWRGRMSMTISGRNSMLEKNLLFMTRALNPAMPLPTLQGPGAQSKGRKAKKKRKAAARRRNC